MALPNLTAFPPGVLKANSGGLELPQTGWTDTHTFLDNYYGRFANSLDCAHAVSKLPSGAELVDYILDGGSGPNRLPWSRQHGSCMIQVEMAGPHTPKSLKLIPDDFRLVASHLITAGHRSPGNGWMGGFTTGDLRPMTNWITSPNTNLDQPIPIWTAYPTITLTKFHPEYLSPGDFDPEMATYFAQRLSARAKASPFVQQKLQARAQRMERQAKVMSPRGRRIPWWGDPDRPRGGVEREEGGQNLTMNGGDGGLETARVKRKARRKRGVGVVDRG
ncbi:MAG: hypothetical protein Q9219_006835 [cf. Caloplaca sp. 3 TL-2023]